VSGWLRRIARRWQHDGGARGHQREIDDLFYKRSLYDSTAAFLEALLALFPDGRPLADADLRRLVDELRGVWGAEKALEEGELEEHLSFWQELARRSGDAYALACYADTLLVAGRSEAAIGSFLEAFALAPSLCIELGDDLAVEARSLGDPFWLYYRLARLRSLLVDAQDGDELRELYSELLEDYSGDSSALDEIRGVGEEIQAAVDKGEVPRAMVRRGRTRTQS
jgi:hypothetical protein